MKRFIYIALLLLTAHCSLLTSEASGQSRTNRLTRPCPGSTTPATVAISAAGNITLTPCSGGTVTTNGVKVYRATLTQTGTSAPVATVLENSTGTTLTWGYTSAGFYTVTAGSAIFTANKVAVYGTTSAAAAVFTIGTSRTSTSVVTVKTWDASGNQVFADGGLTENAFTIFIYP